MKFIIRLIALACFAVAIPAVQTGCTTTPTHQNVAVQTLKSVGEAAEATVALSASLYNNKTITAAQAREVMDLYNNKFQPSFRFAVVAAHSDLSNIASPDIVALANQLSSLVLSFQNKSVSAPPAAPPVSPAPQSTK